MWLSMKLWKRVEWAGKMSKYPAAATKQSRSCDYHYSIYSKINNTVRIHSPIQTLKCEAKVNKRREGECARVMFKMLILFHIFKQS